jgi:hypothetical protein
MLPELQDRVSPYSSAAYFGWQWSAAAIVAGIARVSGAALGGADR